MYWRNYPKIKENTPNYGKIQLEEVHTSFNGVNILDDFSLLIEPGKFISILGTSGIGKTTLLRVISGFKRISAGYVRINGQLASSSFSHMPPEKRNLGFVFQDYALFPHLNVFENIGFGISKKDKTRRIKVDEIIKIIDLDGHEKKYPSQLSGGQQQRVAIARALAMDPKIMLFDEVTSALDPELVDEVLAVLRKLAADSDTTMLTVTHEMNFAQDFADRVLFFDSGQIVESGSPKDLFSNPKEERTKSFLRKFI